MLRKEQNDLVTQTGPDTPTGRLFRCYWTPVLLGACGQRWSTGPWSIDRAAPGAVFRTPATLGFHVKAK